MGWEVYPRRYADYGDDGDGGGDGHPDSLWVGPLTGDFGWRFRDREGKPRAHSEGGFDTPALAKLDCARFILSVRQDTYGLRFEGQLADAIAEVDL